MRWPGGPFEKVFGHAAHAIICPEPEFQNNKRDSLYDYGKPNDSPRMWGFLQKGEPPEAKIDAPTG
jgi:hypothetical protein